MERHITMSGLEQLPVEMLELFLLQLDIVTLKSMCSSSKHMATICQDPYFRKAYKNTHRFSIQLKELFIHLGRIDHLNECPLQQYRHRYIAHGIAPAVAERMAVDKVLLKFLSSPKKTTNTIVKCYEDPFERLLHGQQLRQVTKVAHETLMEKGSSAWLERFKYHDFTNVIDRGFSRLSIDVINLCPIVANHAGSTIVLFHQNAEDHPYSGFVCKYNAS